MSLNCSFKIIRKLFCCAKPQNKENIFAPKHCHLISYTRICERIGMLRREEQYKPIERGKLSSFTPIQFSNFRNVLPIFSSSYEKVFLLLRLLSVTRVSAIRNSLSRFLFSSTPKDFSLSLLRFKMSISMSHFTNMNCEQTNITAKITRRAKDIDFL
jgi:hypothetical protein